MSKSTEVTTNDTTPAKEECMSAIEEVFAKLVSGALCAHSELGTRDESKQKRNHGPRFDKFKTITNQDGRALAMKDVVIPYSPFTGKVDDTYNSKTPFRPILLVSQVITLIKDLCNKSDDVKAVWEDKLGATMDYSTAPTMADYHLFCKADLIRPRVTSYSVVPMSFHGIEGFPVFKSKYTVDPTELNAEMSYDRPTAPVWHLAASMFHAILKPKAVSAEKELKRTGADQEAVSTQNRAIYALSPVGFVRQVNLLPFLFFPYKELPEVPAGGEMGFVQSHMQFYSYTDKFQIAINETITKPELDEDMDFYDLTITTPKSSLLKSNGTVYTDEDTLEIYQGMTVGITDGRKALVSGKVSVDKKEYSVPEVFAPIRKAIADYFADSQLQSTIEGGVTFEAIMAASNRFRPITSVLPSLIPAVRQVFLSQFASSPFYTHEVQMANSTLLTMIDSENEIALAGDDDEEIEAAADAQESDIKDIIASAKVDTVETDTIELDLSDAEEELPMAD